MATLSSDRTADPELDQRHGAGSFEADLPVVEIAFHADLARVGDQLVIAPGESVVIGRDGPAFLGERGGAALADPCISRRQLTLSFDATTQRFQAVAAEDARRPLAAFDPQGRPLADLRALPSGSFLAIGDRALLSLSRRPRHGGIREGSLGLRGDGPLARALRTRIRAVAASVDPVLVLGETGTGKELVARAVHEASLRAREPFIAVNCAALPDALVESELFGHVKGAFSGAQTAAAGVFRAATGGTLLLDEVAELSLVAQAKLLRALETKTVRPVGGTQEVAVDVRIVAATHRDLHAAVKAGTFRADLFARLDGPTIEVPTLRARPTDLPALFVHFLAERRALDGSVEALFRSADARAPELPLTAVLGLLGHTWPRNVRELARYVAKVAAAAREGSPLIIPSLETRSNAPSSPSLALGGPAPSSSPDPEANRPRPTREELARWMEENDYVAHRVAKQLAVPRTTLDRWLRTLGLVRPADLDRAALSAALADAAGDIERAAESLHISARGLRLRLAELGLPTA